MEYISARKIGRCFNGFERDRGTVTHYVQDWQHYGDSWSKALCGTEPGIRGNGWSKSDKNVTCTKCISRYKSIQNPTR